MEIRFDTNSKGRKIAFRWNRKWFRMPVAEAEMLEATESVSTVYYGPNPWNPGRYEFQEISKSDKMVTMRIVKLED